MFCRYQQMNVISHQYVGMNTAACLGCVFMQPVQVKTVILVSIKTRLTVVTTLDNVQRDIG